MQPSQLSFAVGLVILAACSISSAQEIDAAIHWKATGTTETALRFEPGALTRNQAGHVIVRCAAMPDDGARARLAESGIRLLRYLGANAFFAKVEAGDYTVGGRATGLAGMIEIQPAWKVHALLAGDELPEHARFVGKALDGALVTDGPSDAQIDAIAVYVLLHADVELAPTGVDMVQRHGGLVKSVMRSVNGLVAWIPVASLPGLAAEDAVQWLEPPLPPFDEVNDSNRAITQVNTVQAPPYGLDGAGVTVMVYDAGYGYATHPDFGGRLFVRGASELSSHATHVAGTIGGNGVSSGGTYRGMAPAVVIQSYEFEMAGGLQPGFLYTDPGDLEADYDEAINVYGAMVANNSIGTNTAANGFPCSWEGDYGLTSMLIDAIVGGSLGEPTRIVWANGNERSTGRCGSTYHTTAPPACAKNHITVGALHSNSDAMTSFSSWGPTDDGRIKPDVSGPGCQSSGDFGVTSVANFSGYSVKCGTSMASPTVCGIAALILQDFQAQFPGSPLPRNSTLKVLLAHNAVDLGNVGPDYQFGYGSVRAAATIDFLRGGSFREEDLTHGEEKLYFIDILPGTSTLKATLAWDDAPGTGNVIPQLVNDLDISLTGPGGASTHLPWTLNPANPSAPATRNQVDRANNIEQVVVDGPTPGLWTVRVRGHAVPLGPQRFSLATTPDMQACSSTGAIALNRAAYSCTDVVAIQLVDCDLNMDTSGLDTAVVNARSTSAPSGQDVVLTESTPNSGVFVGTIGVSTTEGEGTLLVDHNDVVTLRYDDADDGSGQPAVAEANASIDCLAPTISGVGVTVSGLSATVVFQTDEAACGSVRWGTSCAALTGVAGGTCATTAHQIVVSSGAPSTEHFFVVDAADAQDNSATDDNGGACYTFVTPNILFFDDFPTTTLDTGKWPTKTGSPTVDGVGLGEPSPPYSLRLNGNPSGNESVTSVVVNLSESCGAELSYFYEKTGGGSAPWAGEDLIVEYLTAGGTWVQLGRQAGSTFNMTSYRERRVLLPTGALHAGFRLKIRNIAQSGAVDDWFVDDVQIRMPAYRDCNSNGVPDACDIVSGTSADCQADGIPDECQLETEDCNENGIVDACEFLEKVVASDGLAGDGFGAQVDVSGDVAIVAARLTDAGGTDSGSVYIFRQVGSEWTQEQRLAPLDPGSGDQFGVRVAIDGDRALIGSYREDSAGTDAGAAYIFRFTGSNWVQEAKIIPAGTKAGDQVGLGVAIQGDTAVITGWLHDTPRTDAGAVYVYRRTDNTWSLEAKLTTSDAAVGDRLGVDVGLDGDVLIIGAQVDDNPAIDSGSAYIFRRTGTQWHEEYKLSPPTSAEYDWYGARVAVAGDLAVVSSFFEDDGAIDTGSAYAYRRVGDAWALEAKLIALDLSAGDQFGADVALHGDIALVGAAQSDGEALDTGSVYVFKRIDGAWPQIGKYAAVGGGGGSLFGNCIETDGTTLIMGAPDAQSGNINTGAAYFLDLGEDCNLNGVMDACDTHGGLEPDCNENMVPDSCEIDCNQNGNPDDCDITSGTSSDCDTDGIPDDCQPDCNSNSFGDACDILAGTSEDCQSNGIPDECEPDFDGDGIPDDCELDTDGDGVPDSEDYCPNTPLDIPVNLRGIPLGDIDENCSVTLADFLYFEVCLWLSGPAMTPYFDECAEVFDFDGDEDVDLLDFARLQAIITLFSGP